MGDEEEMERHIHKPSQVQSQPPDILQLSPHSSAFVKSVGRESIFDNIFIKHL